MMFYNQWIQASQMLRTRVLGHDDTLEPGNIGSAAPQTWYSFDKVKILSLDIYSGLSW